ncbi:hypothetical protein ACUXAV_002275 [Cupriavidus metallidurans]|nr:hypothetical protein AU374_03463 [Cupriavidus metallidurans]
MSARLPISASADNLMPHDLPEARIAAANCTETTRSVLPDTQSALRWKEHRRPCFCSGVPVRTPCDGWN